MRMIEIGKTGLSVTELCHGTLILGPLQANMTPEEGGVALTKIEDDFWASKMGQKLIRDRVERCFSEFIARAPAGMLSELGLKRHYKTPEPVKMLRPLLAKR